MAKIEELKNYLTHEFSSGSYTGEDYRTFQTKYINYLKAMCRENHWQLVNVGKNHYCFSAFIKSAENKCVYLSISDVRYFTNEWYGHILIRTAKDEQDYRGGFNHYTTLEALPTKPRNFWTIYPFEEERHETQLTSNDKRRPKGQSILGGECLRGACREDQQRRKDTKRR